MKMYVKFCDAGDNQRLYVSYAVMSAQDGEWLSLCIDDSDIDLCAGISRLSLGSAVVWREGSVCELSVSRADVIGALGAGRRVVYDFTK